ncbi:DNA recombination protein RmuC [Salinisphaera sp. USBA-960]|nr:DNA recombination protein RmuC [Salifodinibacter halophilus]NNC26337.1 DNA recombination protein RmuC [Salifodinibacter halophilus]
MTTSVFISGLVGLVVGGAIAAVISFIAARGRLAVLETEAANAVSERDACSAELERERAAHQQMRDANTRLETQIEAERKAADDKLKELTNAREALTQQFKTLSQEILDDRSKKFAEHSKADLESLIKPLRDHIGRFEKQVRETYDAESQQRSALAEQIRLLEQSNKAIAEDATELTQALKGDSKTQGNWGEMILETVLERSGLQRDTHYDTQFHAAADNGAHQYPDAVIYLPESRSIVVDAKVSLEAYLRVQNAEDDAQRQAAQKEHIESIRRHLKSLSEKNYQAIDAIRTLDYVFMFVPSEAAYVEALRGDFSLQRTALDANIALVSPTTLMPMLRAVANLWRLQQQEENADEIARRAGRLYDKFVGFIDDLDKLGKQIDTSKKTFDQARNKLTSGQGNLVRQTEMLREMGAKSSKQIDETWRRDANVGDSALGDESVAGSEVDGSDNKSTAADGMGRAK